MGIPACGAEATTFPPGPHVLALPGQTLPGGVGARFITEHCGGAYHLLAEKPSSHVSGNACEGRERRVQSCPAPESPPYALISLSRKHHPLQPCPGSARKEGQKLGSPCDKSADPPGGSNCGLRHVTSPLWTPHPSYVK